MEELAVLDTGLVGDLLATGRTAWQVLAGTMGAPSVPAGQVLYAGAPLGVGYLVAMLDAQER
jgi:hypothetical protein